MSEPTEQLYVVKDGKIHAIHNATWESVVANWKRIRISQLRRMANVAFYRHQTDPSDPYSGNYRHLREYYRFAVRCCKEIERLKGET